MILTGKQIKWAKENGYLDISDWDDSRLNPNSYNLRLADEIMVYGNPIMHSDGIWYGPSTYILKDGTILEPGKIASGDNPVVKRKKNPIILDMKQNMETRVSKITEKGYVLQPGVLYLARTMEYTETHKFVPMLEGRSSVGRLGISIHSTAGFGDIGFCGYWTLEISCVQPVRIYAGVEICQIYYHTISPDIWIPDDTNEEIIKYGDRGKYQKNAGIQPSMMWKEFQT